MESLESPSRSLIPLINQSFHRFARPRVKTLTWLSRLHDMHFSKAHGQGWIPHKDRDACTGWQIWSKRTLNNWLHYRA